MSILNIVTKTAPSNTAVSIVIAEGVLDIHTVDDFENALSQLFKNKQYKIVLNLDKLEYISSAGIGVLVGTIKDVRRNRGDIKIISGRPEVYKVFELLDLPTIFKFHKDEYEAAGAF